MVLPLPETGYLRLWQIIGRPATKVSPAVTALIPISRSALYASVAAGRFPKPVKLGPRTTAWRVEDIRKFIEAGDL